jgi:hypothetical protein
MDHTAKSTACAVPIVVILFFSTEFYITGIGLC